MNCKSIIIFGAKGFIGSHYIDFFSSSGDFKLLCFDLIEGDNIQTIDAREKLVFDGKFKSDDLIINLAAIHKTPGHPDYDYFETNILGAQNVCEFAEKVGIKNIIFTSSIAPYGASEDLKHENSLPTPNTPYGISKLVAEEIHKAWAANDPSKKLMILRPGVVFGKGENGNFTRLASAISKGLFFYPGRKDTIKACIYVKELVHQSWELFKVQSNSVQTYNFAYYPALSIEEIAKKIASVLGKKKPSILVNASLLKIVAYVFQLIGLGKIGFHPERVKKLMTSTNISGFKLSQNIDKYKYSFEEALLDWYNDCNQEGLY